MEELTLFQSIVMIILSLLGVANIAFLIIMGKSLVSKGISIDSPHPDSGERRRSSDSESIEITHGRRWSDIKE